MSVTIRYTRPVAGHPEPGSQITVERTDVVDFLLAQGYAVEVPPEQGEVPDPTAGGTGEYEIDTTPRKYATGGIVKAPPGGWLVGEGGRNETDI